MYCRKCGNELNHGDLFCSKCGAEVVTNKPQNEDDPKIQWTEKNEMFFDQKSQTEELKDNKSSGAEEQKKDRAKSKPFHIEGISWDLEGFPSEKKSNKKGLIDFRWNEENHEDHTTEEEPTRDNEDPKDVDFIETLFGSEKENKNDKWEGGTTTRIDKEELERRNGETDSFEEELKRDSIAYSNDKNKVDKFYTLNQKNEEFQQLLDSEYERLRKKLREEEEEHISMQEKLVSLEEAKKKWEQEDAGVIEEEPADISKEKDTDVTDKNEEKVAELKEDNPENIKENVEETRLEQDKPETARFKHEEENEEEIHEDNPDEDGKLSDTKYIDIAEIKKGEEATEGKIDKSSAEHESSGSDDKTEKIIENMKIRKSGRKLDYAQIFKEDGEEGLTYKQLRKKRKQEKKNKNKQKKAGSSAIVENGDNFVGVDSKDDTSKEIQSTRVVSVFRATQPLAIDYTDGKYGIATTPLTETNDGIENTVRKKGRVKAIILDILIVILSIAIILSAISLLAPDSLIGIKVNNLMSRTISVFSKDDSKTSVKKPTEESNVKKAIGRASEYNEKIRKISDDKNLRFDSKTDYGIENFTDTKITADSVWFTDESGKTVTYFDYMVRSIISYYSNYSKVLNGEGGKDEMISLLEPDTSLYEDAQQMDEDKNTGYVIEELKIGEIRQNSGYEYVLVSLKSKDDDTPENVHKAVITFKIGDKEAHISNIKNL